ncbi:MAG: DNA topoisomerase 1b [Terrestrivirus sp.]|uniref:DNA topoisomerase 1b n=1 Tax=Terrestrivirus sp. TaxID=2487775 RepID=A0A3G4ZMA4_9VIRU|nr:MAG: DNA topoisomerase 1b [Terrestrivirus sp.]
MSKNKYVIKGMNNESNGFNRFNRFNEFNEFNKQENDLLENVLNDNNLFNKIDNSKELRPGPKLTDKIHMHQMGQIKQTGGNSLLRSNKYDNEIHILHAQNDVFLYKDTNKPIQSNLLERLKQLRIPSSWKNISISSDENSDIQATGYLEDGTVQHKYHKRLVIKAEEALLMHLYKLAKSIKQLDDTSIFKHLDAETPTLNQEDMEKYLKKNVIENYSLKDLKMYVTNYYFVKCLLDETRNSPLSNLDLVKNYTEATQLIKKNITDAMKKVALFLQGNLTLSKHSYVMNFSIDLYQNDPLFFIKRQNDKPSDVLVELFVLFKTRSY